MRSIIPGDEPHVCFICDCWTGFPEVHHCMHGTANRRLAEADGLKVTLCPDCHRKLHDKGLGDKYLQETAEEAWLKYYGKTIKDWIARYGKNYLERGE